MNIPGWSIYFKLVEAGSNRDTIWSQPTKSWYGRLNNFSAAWTSWQPCGEDFDNLNGYLLVVRNLEAKKLCFLVDHYKWWICQRALQKITILAKTVRIDNGESEASWVLRQNYNKKDRWVKNWMFDWWLWLLITRLVLVVMVETGWSWSIMSDDNRQWPARLGLGGNQIHPTWVQPNIPTLR